MYLESNDQQSILTLFELVKCKITPYTKPSSLSPQTKLKNKVKINCPYIESEAPMENLMENLLEK